MRPRSWLWWRVKYMYMWLFSRCIKTLLLLNCLTESKIYRFQAVPYIRNLEEFQILGQVPNISTRPYCPADPDSTLGNSGQLSWTPLGMKPLTSRGTRHSEYEINTPGAAICYLLDTNGPKWPNVHDTLNVIERTYKSYKKSESYSRRAVKARKLKCAFSEVDVSFFRY